MKSWTSHPVGTSFEKARRYVAIMLVASVMSVLPSYAWGETLQSTIPVSERVSPGTSSLMEEQMLTTTAFDEQTSTTSDTIQDNPLMVADANVSTSAEEATETPISPFDDGAPASVSADSSTDANDSAEAEEKAESLDGEETTSTSACDTSSSDTVQMPVSSSSDVVTTASSPNGVDSDDSDSSPMQTYASEAALAPADGDVATDALDSDMQEQASDNDAPTLADADTETNAYDTDGQQVSVAGGESSSSANRASTVNPTRAKADESSQPPRNGWWTDPNHPDYTYFYSKGVRQQGWVVTAYNVKNNKVGTEKHRYWLDVNGRLAKNRVINPANKRDAIDGCYMAYAKSNGVIATGVYRKDGLMYFANSRGLLLQPASGGKGGWVVTRAFDADNVTRRYYLHRGSNGAYYAKQGFSKAGYAHYTMVQGYVLTGVHKVGKKVFVASKQGRLPVLAANRNSGWLSTDALGQGDQRYFLYRETGGVRAGMCYAIAGFSKDGYAHLTTTKGYVYTGLHTAGNKVYLASKEGRLPVLAANRNSGWVVTDKLGQESQRYYLYRETSGVYAGMCYAVKGYSKDGYAHYTTSRGYTKRSALFKVSDRWYSADEDGRVELPTAAQMTMVRAAKSCPATPKGYCALWVTNVASRAGTQPINLDACDMYYSWCHNPNMKTIKAGSIIAVSTHSNTWAGSIWGHVAVYAGGGKVLDSVEGRVRTTDLSWWVDHYATTVKPCWGWYANRALV